MQNVIFPVGGPTLGPLGWKLSTSDPRPRGSFPPIELKGLPLVFFPGKLLLAVSWGAPTPWINSILQCPPADSHVAWLTHRQAPTFIINWLHSNHLSKELFPLQDPCTHDSTTQSPPFPFPPFLKFYPICLFILPSTLHPSVYFRHHK